jgi:hypothetical protein
MASTSQLLTWIELEMHGWQREGVKGTRALLNEAHRILLTAQKEQNILLDTTTGELPFFTTVDGTYNYSAPTNVWLIGGVVVDDPDDLPDTPNVNYLREWKTHEEVISGIQYYMISNVRTQAARRGVAASLTFMGMNPGDSTALYRRFAYRLPTEITSDAVQHEMPGCTDMDYLMPATMKLIDAIDDHAKMEQARQYIEQSLKPKMWTELDEGEQGLDGYCVKRYF